ncbi:MULTISPECIES: YifB family Mg chelatase-like AAA ATPase [Sutcliffiella]|uniref:Magnesium chelatase n=1 Tax=Sutcliffiella cohnii TaxID=33932 RepID=A0A223KVT0_9BACI|nr:MULTISPECIES: YifB family Mg chelatase-like AAA ATPase [Sutcliffiella]AST93589.1 magnesium chelatase [Sutcliffiella cohnii]WBL14772.1 YifB family Mg chelatase-like AAA ATPase [Sutcliffiella sp. NC1]
MTEKITTIGLKGMEGYRVTVEIQLIEGPECVVIVGLPDASVKEAKERITAALHTFKQGLEEKVVINLSPAEQKKNGPMFDLPMAIGLLCAMNIIHDPINEHTGFIGSLSLDGTIQPVEGMLPAIIAAKKIGLKQLYLPFDEHLPSIEFSDLELIYVTSLQDVMDHLSGQSIFSFHRKKEMKIEQKVHAVTFEQIIGHEYAKRALEVAAAGGHHFFMSGPPGCGKSMLAESFASIMPNLTSEEQLEVMSLYHLSDVALEDANNRPFRTPHHSASSVSIIGGGQYPKPGEISLAHHGVLFLDEIAEFSKKTLDMLRQPIETGYVTISRANATVNYPAQFTMIGAMNPCPCGYLGATNYYCTCTKRQVIAYQNRLSGPIRDRFDIFLSLHGVNFNNYHKPSETSKDVQQRVKYARKMQRERYGNNITNSRVSYDTLLQTSPLQPSQQQMLRHIATKQQLSNRTQIKIIRLARTISDLAQSDTITDQSLWEAVKLNSRQSSSSVIGRIGTAR